MSSTHHPPGSAETVFAAMTDLNGVWRGKRLPAAQLPKMGQGGLRMPLSVCALDIWGEDMQGSGLVLATGDGDGLCHPTGRGPIAMPWLDQPAALLPVQMRREDGSPWPLDARQVLAGIVAGFAEKGLTPVVATELEFYLYDPAQDTAAPPQAPGEPTPMQSDRILSMDDLERFAPLLDALFEACRAAGIPADSATSEAGPGQFEVNFTHVADPMKAADDAVLFKKILRGLARKFGFGASFMAKPYGDRSGSGLHIHFSLLDRQGANVFDDGTALGSDLLCQAVAGLMAAMHAHTLIWAPHANSYRRLVPGAHAPTAICWGYENRTSALRIPGGAPQARRIEHRVAGADANPYLVLAAVLGAALQGIENAAIPPDPVLGNAHQQDLPQLAPDWASAVDAFAQSDDGVFPDLLTRAFAHIKRQEIARFLQDISPFEYQTYMDIV
ncbi:glutamine synthetase family protein [Yoonia sp. BS5-3]|uniref:Glutamine synthetase family protein n=1 Tax=Yoonia phaeophyticola TaxID=3137369 RepID=A0ABZ2V0Z1_9RHOB